MGREEPGRLQSCLAGFGDHRRVGCGLATQQQQQQMIVLAVVFVASSAGQSRGTWGQDFLRSSLHKEERQGPGATWAVRDSG